MARTPYYFPPLARAVGTTCTVAAILWAFSAAHAQIAPPADPNPPKGQTVAGAPWQELKVPGDQTLRYLVFKPERFDATKAYPTLLALPPGNQTEATVSGLGQGYWANLAKTRNWVVIAPAAAGDRYFWDVGSDDLPLVLDTVGKGVRFAGGRVHVVGVSNGGRSVFTIGTKRPDLVHSITSIAGGCDGEDRARVAKAAAIPVKLYVGDQDAPWLDLSKRTKAMFERVGGICELEIMPNTGHMVNIERDSLYDHFDAAHKQAMSLIAESPANVAIIELFTSEGCSSCPAADDAFAALAKSPDALERRLLVLAFHVDYWDHLGWKDRFAKADYTARQRRYASKLSGGTLYTPQIVVGGRVEFVGSDQDRTKQEIAAALAKPAAQSVRARQLPRRVTEPLVLEVSTPDAKRGDLIYAAVVEDGLSSEVKKGENDGRMLNHARVVRAFTSTAADPAHTASIKLFPPKDIDAARASVVIYVQSPGTLEFHTGATMPLAPARPVVRN